MGGTLTLISCSVHTDKQPDITIIHLDLTLLNYLFQGLVCFTFKVGILQYSNRNIHSDEMTPKIWGCKQAVVSTCLKSWEVCWKLEKFVGRICWLWYFCSALLHSFILQFTKNIFSLLSCHSHQSSNISNSFEGTVFENNNQSWHLHCNDILVCFGDQRCKLGTFFQIKAWKGLSPLLND